MTGDEPHVRTIEDRGSWRSRALGALLRLTLRTPLEPDIDIATLRRQYEALDARCFAPDRTVVREGIEVDILEDGRLELPDSILRRLDLDDSGCMAAMAEGVLISINADAHRAAELDDLRFGIGQARQAWLQATDVLNARPLEALRPLLARTM